LVQNQLCVSAKTGRLPTRVWTSTFETRPIESVAAGVRPGSASPFETGVLLPSKRSAGA
jgi:hypothetical protein